MANVVVIGSQWGDEGKGKIVDWLSERADIIVRFQGGHNAGHTLVVNGVKYALSLLPSGVVRKGKTSLIGNGVVVDTSALLSEIDLLKEKGVLVSSKNLRVADNVALILPFHRQLDKAREKAFGKNKIGTTGRGIGPAYEDKVSRRAVRLCDLYDRSVLRDKLDQMSFHHNVILKKMGLRPIRVQETLNDLIKISKKLLPYVDRVWDILDKAQAKNQNILFEGAQGFALDVDHGTYPYVTSSNTVSGQASIGTGSSAIKYVLGITKAYTTRVGSGPFPSELPNKIGNRLGEIGHEYGTVTQRKRRCGWFDSVLVRQAVKIAGINGIALTKLDVLDSFKEIKICTGYKLRGKKIDYFPSGMRQQSMVRPIYETMKGWNQRTRGLKSFRNLPPRAVRFIRRIEKLIGTPVAMISTSEKREDSILIKNPYKS